MLKKLAKKFVGESEYTEYWVPNKSNQTIPGAPSTKSSHSKNEYKDEFHTFELTCCSVIQTCFGCTELYRWEPNTNKSEFIDKAFKKHNNLREGHHVPPLSLNREMCELANKIAIQYARKHKTNDKPSSEENSRLRLDGTICAESLLYQEGKPGTNIISGESTVQLAYDSGLSYTFKEKYDSNYDKFFNIIWKNARAVGIGRANVITRSWKTAITKRLWRIERSYVVFLYSPICKIKTSHELNINIQPYQSRHPTNESDLPATKKTKSGPNLNREATLSVQNLAGNQSAKELNRRKSLQVETMPAMITSPEVAEKSRKSLNKSKESELSNIQKQSREIVLSPFTPSVGSLVNSNISQLQMNSLCPSQSSVTPHSNVPRSIPLRVKRSKHKNISQYKDIQSDKTQPVVPASVNTPSTASLAASNVSQLYPRNAHLSQSSITPQSTIPPSIRVRHRKVTHAERQSDRALPRTAQPSPYSPSATHSNMSPIAMKATDNSQSSITPQHNAPVSLIFTNSKQKKVSPYSDKYLEMTLSKDNTRYRVKCKSKPASLSTGSTGHKIDSDLPGHYSNVTHNKALFHIEEKRKHRKK